ncbi:MAG: LmbE family protein [Ignavibacteria bacterium]|nr:LmbE family protein [Ignavibacteria bacterium]
MTLKGNFDKVDVLAIGAHPDDIELSCGGTIAKLTDEGKSVAIVDCTRGESGTRGTPEIRLDEAKKAAEILGVKYRVNLGMEDGNIEVNKKNILEIIKTIRIFRPSAVLFHPPYERHPDHEAVHKLVRTGMFKSGLRKIVTEYNGIQLEPHRIRKMFCYMQSYTFPNNPDFYVDVSSTHEKKMGAIKAYTSQVFVEGVSRTDEPVTRLSRPEFIDELEARALYFGSLIGVKYAEVFSSVEPIGLRSLSVLL